MADATVKAWASDTFVKFLASKGYDSGQGISILESNDLSIDNSYVTRTGQKGWYPDGILKSSPKINQNLDLFELVTGQKKVTHGLFFQGRDIEFTVSLMCPTTYGILACYGINSITYTAAAGPISSTVDTGAGTPTSKKIYMASVTGFLAGQRIQIPTGASDEGVKNEYKHIAYVDTGSKILYLVEPIFRLPAHGATVTVIASDYFKAGSAMPAPRWRRIVTMLEDQSVRIISFPKTEVKSTDLPGGQEGIVPEEFGVTFKCLEEWDDVAGVVSVNYYEYDRIYKTT